MLDQPSLTREQEQLARILTSSGFKSSRQTRAFLEYVADRALRGLPPVDQAEIAHGVLARRDFDPTTDASVRKLATQVRQRLERYYEKEGIDDDIIVSLPIRTYAPQFKPRLKDPVDAPRRKWLLAAALVVSLTGVALIALAARWWPEAETAELTILTRRGDLRPVADPAPDALRFGPVVGDGDEVRTRLTFRPDREGQHAGIAVWESGTRWISLGRRFTSANVLTLGYQDSAEFRVIGEVRDFEGQSGTSVSLRLLRRGSDWTGYWTSGESNWNELGTVSDAPLRNARTAVFAVNGRRESPSIPAVFHLPGKGVTEPVVGLCDTVPETCQAKWARPAPAGDWSVTARMEMPPHPSVAAGLFLRGTFGRLRLVRYHNAGTQIALIQDGRLLESVDDFPGSPPVYLRLKLQGGRIVAECSVDARRYRKVGHPVKANGLGELREYGALSSRRVGVTPGPAPSPHFFFVQQDLLVAPSSQY